MCSAPNKLELLMVAHGLGSETRRHISAEPIQCDSILLYWTMYSIFQRHRYVAVYRMVSDL